MKNIVPCSRLCRLTALAAILVLSGCSSTLVKDQESQSSTGTSHCSGSEWADDSKVAMLTIPVVAFFMPHADLNDMKADDYLKQCGDNSKLINREVDVGRGACVPAELIQILTLGMYEWCPAYVSWKADVRS